MLCPSFIVPLSVYLAFHGAVCSAAKLLYFPERNYDAPPRPSVFL